MVPQAPLTWVTLLVACALVSGCADSFAAKHSLEGSVGQLYDMGYDSVRIQVGAEDVSLLFVRSRPLNSILSDGGSANAEQQGSAEDYPLKVTYNLWGDDIPVKKRVDLAEVDMNMKPRAVASRDELNDPRKTYPAIRVGSMRFNSLPSQGAKVSGDFNITFTNGIETASGRTVFGSFEAKVAQ